MEQYLKENIDFPKFVTLKVAGSEIGITLRKYLTKLGIEPRAFHIRVCSLYISREELDRVKHLKQNPALLEQLRFHPP